MKAILMTAVAPPMSAFPALSDVAELFADDPEFAILVRKAELLSHAGSLPRWLKGNAVDLLFVLQAGKERGLSTWDAITSLYPSDDGDGLALKAAAQRAMLHRAGWGWRVVESTDERSTVALTAPERPTDGELFVTFTMHDALVAELPSGPHADYWRRWPDRMLYARATTKAVNEHASHVVRGVPNALGGLHADDPAPYPVPAALPPKALAVREPQAAQTGAADADPTPALATAPPPAPTEDPESGDPAPAAYDALATNPHDNSDHDSAQTATLVFTARQEETTAASPAAPATAASPAATGSATSASDGSETGNETPSAEQERAWAVLRRMAEILKPVGVYKVLQKDHDRIGKERQAGRLSAEEEHALRAAHEFLGLSPSALYKELRTAGTTAASAPAPSGATELKLAPRPAMPKTCACDDEQTQRGFHEPVCPEAEQ